jgi:DnaK suppressor protein
MSKKIEALTDLNLHNLSVQLQAQRREILANGKTLRVDFKVDTNELADEVDTAMSDANQGMKMRMGNRESLYFKKIEEALLRMQEGTYGICKECSGQISLRRLEARPTAELCIDCKEQAESREALNAEGRRHKSLGDSVDFKA